MVVLSDDKMVPSSVAPEGRLVWIYRHLEPYELRYSDFTDLKFPSCIACHPFGVDAHQFLRRSKQTIGGIFNLLRKEW